MARQSAMQHLDVLEAANLISTVRRAARPWITSTWQRLCVNQHAAKRGLVEAVARCDKHRLGNNYTNHATIMQCHRR